MNGDSITILVANIPEWQTMNCADHHYKYKYNIDKTEITLCK